MRCAADQFINCAAFDKLRNIWSIVHHTCNGIRVKFRIRDLGLGLGLVLELGLELGLRSWPSAPRVWSNAQNAQIDQMRITYLSI